MAIALGLIAGALILWVWAALVVASRADARVYTDPLKKPEDR
jgi:hypothetical protein